MLTREEKEQIIEIINSSLDKAEEHWEKGGYLLEERTKIAMESIQNAESELSKIPGHPIVQDGETVIDEFIALVMDMRGSSDHLMVEINNKVSGLQRVYYETSALLPAAALTIKFKAGNVTEYLGDGVLALFQINSGEPQKTVRSAYNAASNIIGDVRDIVNKILYDRYRLPPIDLGVGLASSKVLVTLVGLPKEKHPKAFSKCVFRATKLSNGKNRIITDKVLKDMWPQSSGGVLKFNHKRVGTVDGYVIESKK